VIGTAEKPWARRPAIQLQVKTILNQIQPHVGFVFQDIRLRSRPDQPERIEITVRGHAGMARRCSRCQQPAPGYDRLEEREWRHVPLWGIAVCWRYAPRRVECPEHGVVVEHLPWNEGKKPLTLRWLPADNRRREQGPVFVHDLITEKLENNSALPVHAGDQPPSGFVRRVPSRPCSVNQRLARVVPLNRAARNSAWVGKPPCVAAFRRRLICFGVAHILTCTILTRWTGFPLFAVATE